MQYKALIVDDSKLARMVMASAFRRLGPEWELIEATNGAYLLNASSRSMGPVVAPSEEGTRDRTPFAC